MDRHIAAPGQALACKIGQLRIKTLREKAQAALGDRFAPRRFRGAAVFSALGRKCRFSVTL